MGEGREKGVVVDEDVDAGAVVQSSDQTGGLRVREREAGLG